MALAAAALAPATGAPMNVGATKASHPLSPAPYSWQIAQYIEFNIERSLRSDEESSACEVAATITKKRDTEATGTRRWLPSKAVHLRFPGTVRTSFYGKPHVMTSFLTGTASENFETGVGSQSRLDTWHKRNACQTEYVSAPGAGYLLTCDGKGQRN